MNNTGAVHDRKSPDKIQNINRRIYFSGPWRLGYKFPK